MSVNTVTSINNEIAVLIAELFLYTYRVSFLRKLKKIISKEEKRRVVITGLGVVSPIGIGKEAFWRSILNGDTGIDVISRFNADSFPSKIAAEVKSFRPELFLNEKQIMSYARSTQFAYAAAKLAKQDADIEFYDPYRTDIILGAGANSFEFIDEQVFANPTGGRQFIEGAFDPGGIGKYNLNSPACAIAQNEQIKGFVCTIATACTSGLTALGNAISRIRDNYADVVITGATDCAVNHFTLNLFSSARFLSTHNENPGEALCPFDLRRTRSVLGEAAGVLILEEYRHALRRGAHIYAEVVGFHQEYENVDETFRSDKTGRRWADAIVQALPSDNNNIDYINAHATSDIALDAIETKALHFAFGDEKAGRIPTSSIKGMIGSPFAAAGALQLIATSLALDQKKIPQSYNYKIFDPECRLNISKISEFNPNLKQALVNSHSYGGVNASVVLREIFN